MQAPHLEQLQLPDDVVEARVEAVHQIHHLTRLQLAAQIRVANLGGRGKYEDREGAR